MASSFYDGFSHDVPLRSVDADDDDEEPFPTSYCKSIICGSGKIESKCLVCLIATEPASSVFIDAYVKNKEENVLAKVYCGYETEDDIPVPLKKSKHKVCEIYQVTGQPGLFICQCYNKIQPEQSFSWVQQVFKYINCDKKSEIVVLSTEVLCDYKTDKPLSDIHPPFLSALYTSHTSPSSICPTLSQPNIISSLPAQIVVYCEVNDIKASFFVCYTDVINHDIMTVKSFLPILSLSSLSLLQENPEADKVLKDSLKNTESSLLYL
ncbi:hypothetical protein LOTGIDRAFT_228893 [Lottia gigantea]|uniref:Proteasome assembly chaperone 1 n=1 Tax=Lottia gigantea TaxID=225164 RepID=V4A6N8_LOTGI|nr:hypothetical protein LOTGIDRAFT_228893 [Lottia gigantea]ESO88921.1 hypothetical protein LOTGIDRAFT_228893 [Lottia gigantea]